MRNFFGFFGLLIVVMIAQASTSGGVVAQDKSGVAKEVDLPSAEQLHAKHVKAIGGVDGLKKVKSLQMKGVVSSAQLNGQGSFMAYEVPPTKQYIETTLPVVGKTVQVFSGKKGWTVSPVGTFALPPEQVAQQQLQASLQRGGKLAEVFQSAKTSGLEKFSQQEAYAVNVVAKNKQTMTLFYSKKSGLMLGMKMEVAIQNQKATTVVTTGDYRQTGPIKTAHLSTFSMGPSVVKMQITDVKINAKVPEELFSPPANLK